MQAFRDFSVLPVPTSMPLRYPLSQLQTVRGDNALATIAGTWKVLFETASNRKWQRHLSGLPVGSPASSPPRPWSIPAPVPNVSVLASSLQRCGFFTNCFSLLLPFAELLLPSECDWITGSGFTGFASAEVERGGEDGGSGRRWAGGGG